MHGMKSSLLVGAMVLIVVPSLRADELDDLAQKFWTWRAVEQPITGDDITPY